MSSLTKIEREMKSIFVKTLDEIDLAMATKMEGKLIDKFKDSLKDLRIITEEIEKIEKNVILEIDKIKDMTRTELKELKVKKIDELEWLDNRKVWNNKKQIFGDRRY